MNKTNRLFKGGNITVAGNDYFVSVIMMLLEHYDTAAFEGCFFTIWPIFGAHDPEIQYTNINENLLMDLGNMHKRYKRIIFYDLEHTANNAFHWICDEWLANVDEIWTPWIENQNCYGEKHNHKVKFMPLRASKWLYDKHIGTSDDPQYNVAFFGTPTDSRDIVMHKLIKNPVSTGERPGYVINGLNQYEIPDVLYKTKFLLDLTQNWREEIWSQNVVRIHEGISLGKTVITDNSMFNYFPNMIIRVEDPVGKLLRAVKAEQPKDHSQEYWDMTHSDEAYEKYRQDCLKRYRDEGIRLPMPNPYYNRYKRLFNMA